MSTTLREKFQSPADAKLWAQILAMAPFAFQVVRSLRNLGVFREIQKQPGLAFAELQKRVDLSEYSLRVLLDAGSSCGVLFDEDGGYRLSLAGEYLETDRLTNINMNFSADVCYEGLAKLDESLRHNRPEGLKVFGEWATIYEGLTQLREPARQSWFEFDHYFSDDAFPKVLPIVFQTPPRRILDVGGNTGKFAVACTKYNPDVRVTIVDHPLQLELAFKRAEEMGVRERVDGVAMNLLDHERPLPTGCDLVWMSQFLDCFSKDDILQILKRAAAAMTADAHLMIMEPFIDRQKYDASQFCLDMTSIYFTCMANGNSRMYRATDFYELLDQAGFKLIEESDFRLSQTILKCRLK